MILASPEKSICSKPNFAVVDGIIKYHGRLDEFSPLDSADIDADIFIDAIHFKGITPVVRVKSPLAFAIALHIHLVISPHSGVEASYIEFLKFCKPVGDIKPVLKAIRKDCPTCCKIRKQVFTKEMALHPPPEDHVDAPLLPLPG